MLGESGKAAGTGGSGKRSFRAPDLFQGRQEVTSNDALRLDRCGWSNGADPSSPFPNGGNSDASAIANDRTGRFRAGQNFDLSASSEVVQSVKVAGPGSDIQ